MTYHIEHITVTLTNKTSVANALKRMTDVVTDDDLDDTVFEFGKGKGKSFERYGWPKSKPKAAKGWEFDTDAYLFFEAVCGFGLQQDLVDVIEFVIMANRKGDPWMSSIEAALLQDGVTYLAQRDPAYLELYGSFLKKLDAGHDVHAFPEVVSLVKRHGYSRSSMDLLGLAMGMSYHVEDEVELSLLKNEDFLKSLEIPDYRDALLGSYQALKQEGNDPSEESVYNTICELCAPDTLFDAEEGSTVRLALEGPAHHRVLCYLAKQSGYLIGDKGKAFTSLDDPRINRTRYQKLYRQLQSALKSFLKKATAATIVEYIHEHPWVSLDVLLTMAKEGDVKPDLVCSAVEQLSGTSDLIELVDDPLALTKLIVDLASAKGGAAQGLLKHLVDNGATFLKTCTYENSPSAYLIKTYGNDYGIHLDLIEQFIEAGENSFFALRAAVHNESIETLQPLLKLTTDPTSNDDNLLDSCMNSVAWNRPGVGLSEYQLKSYDHYLKRVEQLLPLFKNSRKTKTSHATIAIDTACGLGHLAFVELILQLRPDLDTVDENGRSPLHHACELGFFHIALALLKAGANPDKSPEVKGVSLLKMVEIKNGQRQYAQELEWVLRYLKASKAERKTFFDKLESEKAEVAQAAKVAAETPSIFECIKKGDVKGVEQCLAAGVDLSEENDMSVTPLEYATWYTFFRAKETGEHQRICALITERA